MAVGVLHPRGFVAAGATGGIKASGRPDVAIIAAERAVPAAAVFTRSVTAAAPVALSRAHIAAGAARAIIVQSGNANAATGAAGAGSGAVCAAGSLGAAGIVTLRSTRRPAKPLFA